MPNFIYLFNKYPYWIFWTCCIISIFSPSKCRLFHNATLFGFCVTHILNTECAKIWNKKSVAKRLKVNNTISEFFSTQYIEWKQKGVAEFKGALFSLKFTTNAWLVVSGARVICAARALCGSHARQHNVQLFRAKELRGISKLPGLIQTSWQALFYSFL